MKKAFVNSSFTFQKRLKFCQSRVRADFVKALWHFESGEIFFGNELVHDFGKIKWLGGGSFLEH